jgi:hypothetical protein
VTAIITGDVRRTLQKKAKVSGAGRETLEQEVIEKTEKANLSVSPISPVVPSFLAGRVPR